MKNKVISEGEIKLLTEVLTKVEELAEYHKQNPPSLEVLAEASDIERIHSYMYIDFFGEFVVSANNLRQAIEVPEEEFTALVTENGKRTPKEVMQSLTMKHMAEMLFN